MYHKVSATTADALTVTATQLEAQIRWLQTQEYALVSVSDVVDAVQRRGLLAARSVAITFDDGYLDTIEMAKPVLDRCGVRACVFVPSQFIGATSSWDRDARPLMNATQLHALSDAGWEIGLHSHRHVNYATVSAAEVERDVGENLAALGALGLRPVPALAYPYGRRPNAREARAAMVDALLAAGVRAAFRIGNRVNSLPLTNGFEINRLDVRGDRPQAAFQRKIRFGRLLG